MMSQDRWDAALCEQFRTRVNFSADERVAMVMLYDLGNKYADIAALTGRLVGSVKTFLRDARRAGLIGRRNRVAMRPGANPASPVSVAGSANQATVFPMYSSPIRFAVETGKAITPNTSLSAESNIGPAQ